MTAPVTQQEAPALDAAMEAFSAHSDRREAVLAAARVFRDVLPPRKARAADHKPDPVEAGRAAKKVLDAADRGVLRQPVDDIMVMTGRSLIEAAYPSAKHRPSFDRIALEAAGRAANATYDKLDDRRAASDRRLCAAMGKAGLSAAQEQPAPRRRSRAA